jgi:amino acid adenylation domain-containing protein
MSEASGRKAIGATTEGRSPIHSVVTEWLACGREGADHVPAIQFRDASLSHGALDRLGNQIAHYLIKSGVKRGDRVGLCMDRSVEMVAAMVGILKAGAAYVPLDPDYPPERLAWMTEDSLLRLLLVHACFEDCFEAVSVSPLIWERIEGDLFNEPATPTGVAIGPEDIAYIIFTSGSTGRPKGIAMPHRALSNLIEWQLERRSFKPGARVLQYSSISFDVSFQEIATTLASGGTLFLIGNDDRKDPRIVLRHLIDQRIERLFLPYVALRSIIETAHALDLFPDSLGETITAGEQLRVDDAVRIFFSKIPGATLDNQYGPAETHVVTAHLLDGAPSTWPELPPIGTPLKNTAAYLLDPDMQPVEAGKTGELFLAGRNLACGYFGREDLTREVFVPNPFPGYPRLYRTGDLASCNPDGSINFLGRRDHQIKIRGHRIEPGEVNNAVSAFPGIGHCLTHAVGASGSVRQLAAYYTVATGESVSAEDLRRHLSQQLPAYMVPTFLIELAEIPYTPSGKVDLKALPKPSIENSRYAEEEYRYETETETGLAEVWSELLGLGDIPRTADFFELGGDSLRAVTLFLKIQQKFGKDLPLASLAQAPTIAQLARLIEGKNDDLDLGTFRSLQMLQRGDDDVAPLFLIHGGAGNVLIFNAFARNLDPSQPVYAFQWSGWDGMRGERSIPGMARAYKKELLRFRPSGPYRLGGNCIGGLIAIELANLLRRDGMQVEEPLIVWDAPNHRSQRHRAREPWGRADAMAAFERMKEDLVRRAIASADRNIEASPAERTTGLVGFLKNIPGIHPLVLWSKALSKTVPIRLALWRGRPVSMDLRPTFCLRTMVAAVKRYESPGYDGNMLYIRSYCVFGSVLASYAEGVSRGMSWAEVITRC